MKKGVLCAMISLCCVLGVSSTFAGGEYDMYGGWYNDESFTVQTLTEASKNQSIQTALIKNFDRIAQNTVYEDYEYNTSHFYTKALEYSIFLPKEISWKVAKINILLSRGDSGPIMYDASIDTTAKTSMEEIKTSTLSSTTLPINTSLTLEELSGSLTLERNVFDALMTQEYGESFSTQLQIVLTDGTVIPYSPKGYIYMQADSNEGKKEHLSNLYYANNPSAGYPDVGSLLKNAFAKLEAKLDTLDAYLTALQKVSDKATQMAETYTKAQDALTENIKSEGDFEAKVEAYGVLMQKANILSDASYQIGSEIQTRKNAGVIDELFSDF